MEEKKQDAKEGSQVEQELQLGVMNPGDYMIHVYLIKGRNFKLDDDEEDDDDDEVATFNALTTVSCGGQKFYSKCLKDCPVNSDTGHYWGEHFFFEPRGLSVEDVQSASIEIRVQDKCLFKNKTVGVFDLDISHIYFMNEEHAMEHKWVAINNPEGKNHNVIKGYLQISVAVQGPGDSSIKLTDPEGSPIDDMDGQDIIMPASIRKGYKQLRMSILQAQKLPKYDTFGSIDAYINGTFNEFKYKSKVVTQKNNLCQFNQSFLIPIQWPPKNDRLVFKVWDEDKVNDEIVSTLKFSIRDLVKKFSIEGGDFLWQNLYGGPVSLGDGPNKNLMNANPDYASTWKGRFLFHFAVEDARAPKADMIDMPRQVEQLSQQVDTFKMREFEIKVEIGVGVQLPDSQKYKVRVQIADFIMETKSPKEQKASYCRWSEQLETGKYRGPYRSVEELGRIYFYLMDGSTPVCFWRGEAKDFTNLNPSFQWLPLTNDLAIGKVKSAHKAGMIQAKLSIHDATRNPQARWDQQPSWKQQPPKRFIAKQIRCYIFQCKDLPAADSSGTSDPYVKVWNPENKQVKTKVVHDNLNPIFYETLDISFDMGSIETAPPLMLDLYDYDSGLLDSTDDFLGRAVIPLTDESVRDVSKAGSATMNKPPPPKWHDIKAGFHPSLPACGQILCSFAMAEYDSVFAQKCENVRLAREVKTQLYNIDIHVLGLRELQSFGILPIRKAFVKFNTRSMLPPERAHAVTNIQTEPKQPGPNPNINTTVSFSMELPINSLYCPKLQCDVFDQICKGLSQPLIGTFTISIGEIMAEEERDRAHFLEWADQEIAKLEEVKASTEFDPEGKEALEAENLNRQDSDQVLDTMVERLSELQSHLQKPHQKARLQAMREKFLKDIESYKSSKSQKSGDYQHGESDDEESGLLQESEDQIRSSPQKQTLFSREPDGEDQLEGEDTEIEFQVDAIPDMKSKEKFNRSKSLLDEILQKSQDNMGIPEANSEQLHVLGLFKKASLTAEVSAMSEFKGILAKLKKRRETQATREGLQRLKTRNRILEKTEKKLLDELASLAKNVHDAKRAKLRNDNQDDQRKLIEAGIDVSKNVVYPQYKRDPRLNIYREINVPPSTIYYPLGYAGVTSDNTPPPKERRHYRKVYQDELENNKEIFSHQPFQVVPIKRGQSRGVHKSFLKSLFSGPRIDDPMFESTLKQVGSFKGYIKIENKEDTEAYEQKALQKIEKIQDLIEEIYFSKFQDQITVSIKEIDTQEEKTTLREQLLRINAYSESLMKFVVESNFDKMIESQLSSQHDCLIRLYLLEGFDFSSRDIGSFSDPYMVIKCGKTQINQRDKYQIDEPNPKFFEVFEFNCKFPGSSPLEIEAYDYDDLFGDDLIGKTVIDLDDRQFSPEWKAIKHKPVEYRELYHPSTSLAQGTILCWVDIFSQSSKKGCTEEAWKIEPEPVKDYQLRLSVYDTENVPMLDAEGTSDIFVKAWIDDKHKKETDTHWRCQDGEASFNYRLIYDFESPCRHKSEDEAYKLKLQVLDRDLFKSNDLICQFELDLKLLVQDCRATQKPIHLSKKYFTSFLRDAYYTGNKIQAGRAPVQKLELEFKDDDSFWLVLKKEGSAKPIKLRLDVRILPGDDATNQKVGEARVEPNHSPSLPKPEGRVQLTANPLKMLEQMVGADLRKKIYANLCLIGCVFILTLLMPMIVSEVAAKLFLGVFGLN